MYSNTYIQIYISTMSDKKTIQVNMDLFDIPSRKTRKKKDGNNDASSSKKDIKIKSNAGHNKTTKNKLLRYIREQQEKNYEKLFEASQHAASASASASASTSSSTPSSSSHVPDVLANSKSDFEQSVAYMKTVEDENKRKQLETQISGPTIPKNQTIKHRIPLEEIAFHQGPSTSSSLPPISLNAYPNVVESIGSFATTPDVTLKPRNPSPMPPTYGCLKNGNLPTYRTMMQQTLKNHATTPNTSITFTPNVPSNSYTQNNTIMTASNPPMNTNATTTNSAIIATPINTSTTTGKHNVENEIQPITRLPLNDRNAQLKALSEMNQLRSRMQEIRHGAAGPKNLKYLKRKKTLRRTYHVGKSKVHPKVSVLVTNRTIRKKISTHAQQLKQIPIEEIRKYLTQKGLIKIGSTAPNDVLRQMYENAVLIGGDVTNHNPENLLYNYMNGPNDSSTQH